MQFYSFFQFQQTCFLAVKSAFVMCLNLWLVEFKFLVVMCLEIYIILQINQFIGTDSCHIHAKKRGNDYMTGQFFKS